MFPHTSYQRRISNVLHHVLKNRDEEPRLRDLSALGHFSPYHFHRIMSAYLGEPLMAYIRRIRLEKAAESLIYSRKTITEIALDNAFVSPSVFSKAFRRQFGQAPSDFRKIGKADRSDASPREQFEWTPQVVRSPERSLAYTAVRGKGYSAIAPQAWEYLYDELKDLPDPGSREIIGISWSDPSVNPQLQEYWACIAIAESDIHMIPDTLGIYNQEGGLFARFTFEGNVQFLGEVYDSIYRNWVLKHGIELRDVPTFDMYQESSEKNPISHIHVPIKNYEQGRTP